ncbi:hypothetical protein Taro_037787 [Colocasia esculenta]|uniref:Uncharacterized protein n=1 Tax=Colocasia esculenta TaxID=4460 RepID=A0A843WBZ7_COLES|nr:hypothetical protein [Colocasia esculenta]
MVWCSFGADQLVRLHSSTLCGGLRRRGRIFGPVAAVPMVGSLVGAGGSGVGAVTVDMPPRKCRQVRELMEHQDAAPGE